MTDAIRPPNSPPDGPGPGSNVVPFPGPKASAKAQKRVVGDVCFQRQELMVIMALYGQMVAAGEWRDYALSHNPEKAVFAIFRRTSEHPIYRIEKRPADARRQGQYCVKAMDERVLKRGSDLRLVLRVFAAKLSKLTLLD